MCIRDREETEMEIIVEDAQADQPKKPNQPMNANFQEMMRIIMEVNKKNSETLLEQINEILDKNHEELMKQMDESFRKLSKPIDGGFKKCQETLDSTSGGVKEIENKEDKSILLDKNKHSRNKENNKYVIKKTKKIGKTHPKKIKNTREELEMMNNGLINVLNILSTNYRRISNFKDNKRNSIETFKGNSNKIVRKNVRKTIGKLNITEIEMCSKLSVMSSIIQIPLKYLFNKINGKVIDVGICLLYTSRCV